MNQSSYTAFVDNGVDEVNRALSTVFDGLESDITVRAALYSLTARGKRIRPLLMMTVGHMLSVQTDRLMPFASAIEMIHTYSLIHDDLPCMDDDDLRRGKPTCHVRYSEAIALLAGDALLNGAYEILFEQCVSGSKEHCKAGAYIAGCAGIKGMIGGQSEDISSTLEDITPERLYSLHRKKTGALILASVMVPYLLSDSHDLPEQTGKTLESYASHLGLSFQIKDDLLDVSSTSDQLGKTAGKDTKAGKSTFVTVFGFKEAEDLFREEAKRTRDALDDLRKMKYNTDLITSLTKAILEREK
ncbi:MAG: polyprenyl synthetase family protein [Clostridiales bacterium]|nr:polyprenyl synthetase family protein [Clostridiales bacterium]